jgi:hypothetical protein
VPVENRYPTPVIIDVTQPSAPPPPVPPSKTASTLAKVWAFARKYVLGPIPALLLLVGACVLIALGVKNVQIGGLLGKLLGKGPSPHKAIETANSVPPGRVRPDRTLIPIGEADSEGITQAQVLRIEQPGVLSDPRVIKVTPPGSSKPIEIQVPDGVKAKDVDQVVVVTPQVIAVTVKSSSPIKAQDVDDLIAKYR